LKREFDEKKWLNMNSKPDKECEKRGDIVLLSEIIANSIYWQVSTSLKNHHLDAEFNDITAFPNVETISINHRFSDIWF
jgi:hypothetical protein